MEFIGELPFGTEMPGKIRFFEDKEVLVEREFDTLVRVGCTEATDVLNPTLRLGLNMYSKDTSSVSSSSMTSLSAQSKSGNLSQAAALKAFSSADKSGEGFMFYFQPLIDNINEWKFIFGGTHSFKIY